MSPSVRPLSTYLNHHLSEETLGLDLATRAAVEHKGTRLGTFLELLSWELEDDRDSLLRLMGELGVRRKSVGMALAKTADAVGRIGHAGVSPMSTLIELESLDLRITGKLDMWGALRTAVGDRVDGIDFDRLIDRAEGQAEALKSRRLAMAHGSTEFSIASLSVNS